MSGDRTKAEPRARAQPRARDAQVQNTLADSIVPGAPERIARRDADFQTQADRYDVEGEHARGGLGVILRARDLRLERTVAIKELGDAHATRAASGSCARP